MLNYIIRRILIIPIMLFGITFLIFSMNASMWASSRNLEFMRTAANSPEILENLEESELWFNDSLIEQYWQWIIGSPNTETGEITGGLIRGNLGMSAGGVSVSEEIATHLPATVELVLFSAVPILVLGIWMGVKSAENHNKMTDYILRISAIIGWSIPTFVLGLFFLVIFYVNLGWFAPGRLSMDILAFVKSEEFIKYTNMYTIDSLLNGRFDIFIDAIKHIAMPVLTLSITSWAFLLRITRSSMLETLQEDYITAARSKGLPEEMIMRKHALPNAYIPVITVGGMILIGLFNTIVFTEAVFNYPGIGYLMANAALGNSLQPANMSMLSALVLFSGVIIIAGNLIIDILYGLLDPRIRLE